MALGKMWTELNGYLDDDERLVYPEMYLENRHLYDGIRDIVYLIKERDHPDSPLEWVSELALPKVLKDSPRYVDILAKQVIVRLRLPWAEVRKEWLITQEELDADREHLEVVDIFLKVRRKGSSKEVPLLDILEFEANRDEFEVVEARYLVSFRLSAEKEARLLGIPPDSIYTYMQQ